MSEPWTHRMAAGRALLVAVSVLASGLAMGLAPGTAAADHAGDHEQGVLDGLRALGESLGLGSADEEFLAPDQAFAVQAMVDVDGSVLLSWRIAPGYYLYRSRLAVRAPNLARALPEPLLPAGVSKRDEYFGEVEVYYGALEARLPIARDWVVGRELLLEISYQGCAEAGLCYPLLTRTLALDYAPATKP